MAGRSWALGLIPIFIAYIFFQIVGSSSDLGYFLTSMVDLVAIGALIYLIAKTTPLGFKKIV